MTATALAAVRCSGRKAGLGWSCVSAISSTHAMRSPRRIEAEERERRVGTYVALAADLLVAVEFGGKGLERGLDDSAAEAKDEVEGRFLRRLWLAKCIVDRGWPKFRLICKYVDRHESFRVTEALDCHKSHAFGHASFCTKFPQG